MQLRLNSAHPLCSPSRNLVFATFGTGAGGQVLDLSDRPSHGVIRDDHATPQVARTLQSVRPPGAPADYSALAFRGMGTTYSGVDFANASKAFALTDNFTVAMWVRPWHLANPSDGLFYPMPLSTGGHQANAGFALLASFYGDLGLLNGWGLWFTRSSQQGYVVSDVVLQLGQWNLVAFSFNQSRDPRVQLFTNGAVTGTSYSNGNSRLLAAGNRLTLGYYSNNTTRANCDIGPVIFWGSVLTAEDIALLYRDTWGMVSRVGMSTASRVSASVTTTTTTTTTSTSTSTTSTSTSTSSTSTSSTSSTSTSSTSTSSTSTSSTSTSSTSTSSTSSTSTSSTSTSTSSTTTTTLAVNRPTLGGRGFGSPYIGGYRPGFMRKD